MTSDRSRRRESAAKRIALVVRQGRKRLGVTQQALAQMAGCGLVFVYNIEHGKPSLRFDKLLDVLEVLGLELIVTTGASGPRAVVAAHDVGRPER
jgi:HTH-type transcriptional regulator / antitoxin HipB